MHICRMECWSFQTYLNYHIKFVSVPLHNKRDTHYVACKYFVHSYTGCYEVSWALHLYSCTTDLDFLIKVKLVYLLKAETLYK